jgi:hypothetical protein
LIEGSSKYKSTAMFLGRFSAFTDATSSISNPILQYKN